MKMPSTEIHFLRARVVRTMSTVSNFLAVDLGASSGRVVIGHWDGKQILSRRTASILKRRSLASRPHALGCAAFVVRDLRCAGQVLRYS